MNPAALLWPAIAEAALIGVIYAALFFVRQKAIREGRVATTDFAPGDEPADSAAVRRHLVNHFELPVLFFAVIAFLVALNSVSRLDVWLAWGFVASRVVHTVGSLRGPLAPATPRSPWGRCW